MGFRPPGAIAALPPSVGKLEKYVLAYATANGLAVGRVRHCISFIMLSGAFDQAARQPDGPRFVVEGGELRLQGRARATDDLDVVVRDEEDLVGAFCAALRTGYGDCTFTRRADVHPLADEGVRVWVQIAYRRQHWATVRVDLAYPDPVDAEQLTKPRSVPAASTHPAPRLCG
jgi:hypothetical protein